jgi:hypothetical protein
MTGTTVGSLKCRVTLLDNSGLDITHHDIKFVAKHLVTLFRINKVLKNEYHLTNKGLSICLSKGSVSVTCDRVMRITQDSIWGFSCY